MPRFLTSTDHPNDPLRLLSSKKTVLGSYDPVAHVTMRVKAPPSLTPADVFNIVQNAVYEGCNCEHDCCGHIFTSVKSPVRPRNRNKNEWIVGVLYQRNV